MRIFPTVLKRLNVFMIRKYSPTDFEAIINLLRLNTPEYFDPTEEADFVLYLQTEANHYFVYELSGEIVGCGGINFGFDDGKTARLSWDIIHPLKQGEGIGKKLTVYRMEQITKDNTVERVCVRTTQMAFRFYEKVGFRLEKIERDYWAQGFDLYEMYRNVV